MTLDFSSGKRGGADHCGIIYVSSVFSDLKDFVLVSWFNSSRRRLLKLEVLGKLRSRLLCRG